MKNWLDGDWQALVVELASKPTGYLLFQVRSDEYRPSEIAVYLRQFFIEEEHRSQGIGRRAFEIVAATHFRNVSLVVLDVLETNSRARRFWELLGFEPYCTTMRLKL